MSASAAHAALVDALADLISAAGFAVTRLDSPGERQPLSYGGHRPDVVAEHLVVRVLVIGEAKTPDDLFTVRSLAQFRAFSTILVPHYPPTYAHLVVAVPTDSIDAAWRALALADAAGPNVTVAGHGEDTWLITSRRPDGAASWHGFALATRLRSSRYAVRFTQPASAGGAATSGHCRESPT